MSLFNEAPFQTNGTNGNGTTSIPTPEKEEALLPVQTTIQKKHEIKFDEKMLLLDNAVKARMDWIAQGHETQCPCCHSEFTHESFGNPACKSGPVCLGCGWSHCG